MAVTTVTHPAVLLSVEDLGREDVPLSLLLDGVGPHEVPLFLGKESTLLFPDSSVDLHAGCGDVAELDGDAQALQDHHDTVLGVTHLGKNWWKSTQHAQVWINTVNTHDMKDQGMAYAGLIQAPA